MVHDILQDIPPFLTAFRVLLMDLSQAAFGLDMRAASRIYFISPVLNPQVEAQAIGRIRRVSQHRPVSVETLVLKGSIDEVLLQQKQHMSQADLRRARTILDVQPVYDWIKNAAILGLPAIAENSESQMAPLAEPRAIFGSQESHVTHPDEGLVATEPLNVTADHTGPKRRAERKEEYPGELKRARFLHTVLVNPKKRVQFM